VGKWRKKLENIRFGRFHQDRFITPSVCSLNDLFIFPKVDFPQIKNQYSQSNKSVQIATRRVSLDSTNIDYFILTKSDLVSPSFGEIKEGSELGNNRK